MSIWKDSSFRTIYNRVQRQHNRLTTKQGLGIELTTGEKQFLAKKPVDLSKTEYKKLLEIKHKKRIEREQQLAKQTLQYDRFIDPSAVLEYDSVKVGDDYYPVAKPKQKRESTGWEGYTM